VAVAAAAAAVALPYVAQRQVNTVINGELILETSTKSPPSFLGHAIRMGRREPPPPAATARRRRLSPPSPFYNEWRPANVAVMDKVASHPYSSIFELI